MDGLQMPCSSSFLTRLASVYLGGCGLNFSVARIPFSWSISPLLSLGSIPFVSSSSSSLSEDSIYTFRNQSNLRTSPLATK